MILLIIVLDRRQAEAGGEVDVSRGAVFVFFQADLDQMQAEVLRSGLSSGRFCLLGLEREPSWSITALAGSTFWGG